MLFEVIAKVFTLLTLKGLIDVDTVITLAIVAVIVWIIYTKMNYIRGIKLIGVWLVLYVLSSIFQAFFFGIVERGAPISIFTSTVVTYYIRDRIT